MSENRSTYFDASIILLVLIAALSPLVFGQAVMKWDAMDLYLPWKYFITDTLSNNQLPLWNPFINGGFSQMGDPGTWYPISWGVGALFGGYSIGALHFEYLLHLYLGGLGFYFLLKQFGFSRAVLVSCAAGYMLSGLMIGNAQHVGWVVSAAWLPWVLHYYLKLQNVPKFRTAIQLALVLFFLLSGGYPGMFIVTIYVLFGYFIANSWKQIRSKNYHFYRKQWLFFGISAGLFVLMSAVVLVAAFDMAPLISRGTGLNGRADVWNTLEGSLSPQALTSYFYPLATAKNDFAFWEADFSMTNCYFGVLLLLTIFATIFRKDAPKNARIYFGVGVLFIMISLGQTLPVRTWTTYLPFMDLFRFPSLFRLFALFFLLMSAGFSLQHILSSEKRRKQFVYFILGAILALGLVNIVLFSGVEKYKFGQIFTIGWDHFMEQANINELVFFQGGVMIVSLASLILAWKYLSKYRHLSILLFIIFEAVSFTWMNRYATVLYDRPLSEASGGMEDLPDGYPTPSTWDPISVSNDADLNLEFIQLWKNLSIYVKRPTLDGISPYCYTNMSKAVEVGEYDRMGQYPVIFFAENLMDNNYIDTTSIDTLSAQKLWIETFGPNELKVNVELPEASNVVYLQNYYPSWKAEVDGKIIPIQRVSETFMSVPLPKGKSTVEFSFEPMNVIRASFVSIAVWAGALLFLILTYFMNKRRNPN
ncbi:MAG: YfhO family protein [Crocinitomicaceae bacterium]|nr:YfhO family protein [Crocinitomicaceae bacterium]